MLHYLSGFRDQRLGLGFWGLESSLGSRVLRAGLSSIIGCGPVHCRSRAKILAARVIGCPSLSCGVVSTQQIKQYDPQITPIPLVPTKHQHVRMVRMKVTRPSKDLRFS